MISALIGYIWNSGVLVGSLCTILFLIIIRSYSRDVDPSDKSVTPFKPNNTLNHITNKATDKIGNQIKSQMKSANREIKDVLEGLSVNKDDVPSLPNTENTPSTNQLDAQFYGELFVASALSGMVVKAWWK